jgi:hypothetical protein
MEAGRYHYVYMELRDNIRMHEDGRITSEWMEMGYVGWWRWEGNMKHEDERLTS